MELYAIDPSKATAVFAKWEAQESVAFMRFIRKTAAVLGATYHEMCKQGFSAWKNAVEEERKRELGMKERNAMIEVLKTSVRGQRTTIEKEIVRKFIKSNLHCIPSKEMSFSEMDRLCNEVDWFPCLGRSIVFLQGDFGNCENLRYLHSQQFISFLLTRLLHDCLGCCFTLP